MKTEHLIQAYFIEDSPDPHRRFAELSGMSREEAKVYFYRWAYSKPIFSGKRKEGWDY